MWRQAASFRGGSKTKTGEPTDATDDTELSLAINRLNGERMGEDVLVLLQGSGRKAREKYWRGAREEQVE